MSRRLRSASALLASLVWAAAPAFAQAPAGVSTQASATSGLAGRPFPRSAFPASPYASHPEPIQPGYLPPEVGGGQVVRVDTGGGAVQTLSLPRGKSATIELPTEARDVMVSDPKVADVVLSTPRRIYVLGVASGQTDALFVDGLGRRILRLEIRVDQDSSAAAETIARLMPSGTIRVQAANNNLILSGTAANPAEADKAVRLAASFVADPKQVINLIDVTGAEQVRLEVKIVEVNRTVIKQLGFDLNTLIGAVGGPQYSFFKSATYGVAGALLGGLTGGYNINTTNQPASAVTSTSVTNIANASSTTNASNIAALLGATGSTAATSQLPYGYNAAVLVNPATGLPISINGVQQSVIVNGAGQVVTSSGLNSSLTNTLNGGTSGSLSNGTTTTISNNGLNSKSQQILSGRVGESGVNQANAMIQAFERVGLVRTLAEPNLTAISGESGKFLAGGEFPVPTSQDLAGRVSVEFKPYGVGLGYTPVVLSSGRISLKMSVEVSELTSVGGFTLSAGGGGATLSIPGLNVRRSETTVELPSGGSMVIAGLLQSQTKETLDSLPGLMQIPIIGSLLRSRDFQNNESELVIIVTPYLVKPVRPDQITTPADGLKFASDLETNLLGRLNTGFGKKPTATAGQHYQGPFGYVVD